MMPAASTSDHRTYSSMTNGVAGMISPTARRSGEGRAGGRATPAERAASDARGGAPASTAVGLQAVGLRSEEHTSELQSQSNLVCRLLLEKKKTQLRRPLTT